MAGGQQIIVVNGFTWVDVTNKTWGGCEVATMRQVIEAGGDPDKVKFEVSTA